MGNSILKVVWFGTCVVALFTFIAYSTMLPLFGADTQKAWQWLLPNLLPPLGIVFGIDFALGKAKNAKAAPAASATPGWTIAVSTIYLLALIFAVFGVAFATDPIGYLNMSNYWLAPLLMFSTAMLGARFAKQT